MLSLLPSDSFKAHCVCLKCILFCRTDLYQYSISCSMQDQSLFLKKPYGGRLGAEGAVPILLALEDSQI